jgi:hypothetical protein
VHVKTSARTAGVERLRYTEPFCIYEASVGRLVGRAQLSGRGHRRPIRDCLDRFGLVPRSARAPAQSPYTSSR